jgi:NAD(P)-dependent dehydrogenase (short-subunit alcohol dehydrogenase family)
MNIENKVAIVTGGASGLGLGTVKALAEKGAKVVIFDLNEEKAQQACHELGESVSYAVVNVSDEASVQAGIQKTMEQHGALHICINCAGIGTPQKILGRAGVIPFENFKRVVDVNLFGTVNVLRLAAEQIAKNEPLTDSGERGVIINTASFAA